MRKRRYWFLLAQAGVMLLGAAVSVSPYFLYGIMEARHILTLTTWLQWILNPVLGLGSAYFVTRKRINQYLAWILPPVCYTLLPLLLIGYFPSAGVMLVTAFTGVVGAAAGEVKNRMEQTE